METKNQPIRTESDIGAVEVAPPVRLLSLDDLDMVGPMAEGREIELVNASGEKLGVFLHVLGEQSPVVQKYLVDQYAETVKLRMAATLNKQEFNEVERTLHVTPKSAAVRVTAWRGLSEPCTPENALRLMKRSRAIAEQVLIASADEKGFTKALQTS